MYTPGIKFERTEEERNNQMASWKRADIAFFAAGACHILAFTMKALHPERNFTIIHIKPAGDYAGNHVYVVDGEWAFDFNGWTKEAELLDATKKAYSAKYPNWGYERVVVTTDLETFCQKNHHRPPAYFTYLPWERTYKFIERFSDLPPEA